MSTQDPEDQLARVLSRLDQIEARLQALEAGRNPRPAYQPAPSPLPAVPREEAAPEPPPIERPALETRVGLTWLNRVGVLTVVLGVAFFFKYAIDNGLIGETGRVVLGVLTGLGALGLAEFLSRRGHRVYSQGITGAGIAILYLSLYSAFGFYHLLPQLVVFALMFLTTAAAVGLSLHYDAIAIAALGLSGGYLTPLVLRTNDDRPWMLFGYIFILAAGGMALVNRKDWKRLEPLSLGGTVLVYLPWFLDHFQHGKETVATVSALALYALFWYAASPRILMGAQFFAMLAIRATWAGMQVECLWINLVLGAAGLTAATRRRLPEIAGVAFGAFWFAAALWHLGNSRIFSSAGVGVITAALFLFLGYAIWEFSADRSAEPPAPLLGILGLNGLAYFGICYFLMESRFHTYLGLLAVGLAAIHFFAAWFLSQRLTAQRSPVLLSVGAATAFVTLAIPIQFSQFRITMGWAIEGALFTWIAIRTDNRRFGSAAIVMFGLAFARLALVDARLYNAHARLLTFLVTGVCYWLGSRWMKGGRPALAVYLCGHVVVLWGLLIEVLEWAGRHTGDTASISTLSISVLLGAYGVVMVVLGVTLRAVVNRLIGLALFAAVILKLYFYDVWQLQQTFRVVAFVVLGVLLLTASFLYSRFRPVVEKLWDRQ